MYIKIKKCIALQSLCLPQYAMQYEPTNGDCVIGTINRNLLPINLADQTSDQIVEVYVNEDVRGQLSREN